MGTAEVVMDIQLVVDEEGSGAQVAVAVMGMVEGVMDIQLGEEEEEGWSGGQGAVEVMGKGEEVMDIQLGEEEEEGSGGQGAEEVMGKVEGEMDLQLGAEEGSSGRLGAVVGMEMSERCSELEEEAESVQCTVVGVEAVLYMVVEMEEESGLVVVERGTDRLLEVGKEEECRELAAAMEVKARVKVEEEEEEAVVAPEDKWATAEGSKLAEVAVEERKLLVEVEEWSTLVLGVPPVTEMEEAKVAELGMRA
ncbi:hypothetical protein MLD38_015014 [Melastoma candidum]|uniref:Uncharacterized protein n=1 Tax=Melastoma candidum TaxID=119954 RepID=A0ACB9RN57_9MYRT|nr:hypothetical protein MLD38_015014 [Melastoma candidum]